ncbi:MAG: SpoIIE family protein phosphatase [Bacteroidota bacterium]
MSKSSKPKILLVEDEQNIARLFKFNLTRAGYDVEHASDGEEGFELAKSANPDLIISDIMMPKVDGFVFRELLLTDEKLKYIPFIFLTAKGSEEEILHGYNYDIQEYIVKTSSPKIILAKLKAVLKSSEDQKHRGEKEVQQAAETLGATVVPENFPKFEGYEIEHWHIPFRNIPGGDFIDYVQIDNENLAVVMGDVMGKKWGAWYFAVAYAGYVRSAIRFVLQDSEQLTASKIVQRVNESVYFDERISEVFITLSIMIINKKENKINYCGAGDLPIFHFSNGKVKVIKSTGLLLGFSMETKYVDQEIQLSKGDEVYMLTDGILESRDSDGIPLESHGFIRIIQEKKKGSIIQNIQSKVIEITDRQFEDDISVISIKVNQ